MKLHRLTLGLLLSACSATQAQIPKNDFLKYTRDKWQAIGKQLGLKEDANHKPPRYVASAADSGFALIVDYSGKRIDNIHISEPSGEFEATKKRILESWRRIDPRMADVFAKLYPGSKADEPHYTGLYWLDDTEYAYGYAAFNKTFIEYVGPRTRHKALAKQGEQVSRLIVSWFELLKKSQADASRDVTIDSATKAFDYLWAIFSLVEIPADLSESDYRAPREGFESFIWGHWTDLTKIHMMRAAARIEHSAFLARRQLWQGQLTFQVYDDMVIALSQEGNKAMSAVFGRYGSLVDHAKVCKLPPEVEAKMAELSMYADAAMRVAQKDTAKEE